MEHSEELERAQAAKEKAKAVFGGLDHYSGTGLTYRSGQYSVKVLLSDAEQIQDKYPDTIDGFPVVFQVIGKIRKQPEGDAGRKSVRGRAATKGNLRKDR